jgi:crotonobetainyl-CoA:carnitine CoA-transferase CaiB-like acyl-CoA transferase
LRKLDVTERFGPASTELTRTALSFAGLLAAEFGAEVCRVEPAGGDPMRGWPPLVDGTGSLFRFLTRGKRIVAQAPASQDGFLLTDDPAAAAAWPAARSVLVQAGNDEDTGPATELTTQARAGLLDIFAGTDGRPQPLPGQQMAYATGTAAFCALLAARLAADRGLATGPTRVAVQDVALWVNWKHYLAAVTGEKNVGLGRAEDWTSLRCKDGFIAVTFQDKDMASLAKLTGNPVFLDARFRTRALRARNVQAINTAIEAWALGHTRAEAVRAAQALRIPIGPVLQTGELAGDRQFAHRAFLRPAGAQGHRPRLPLLWNGSPVGDGGPVPAAAEGRA